MKTKLLVIWLALLCLSASARAQVFDAGYTFTYYFTSLPTFHAPIAELETGLFLLPGFQNVTATIQWEIFDSLPAGVPAHSGTLHPGAGAYIGLFDQTWLDAEGSFRISILSGSQRIDNYYIYLARPDATGFTIYSATIPPSVPEPTVICLLSFGVLSLAALKVRAKSSNQAMQPTGTVLRSTVGGARESVVRALRAPVPAADLGSR